MRIKPRVALNGQWPSLRATIAHTILEKKISPCDFRALNIHENFKQIEEKIYSTFCHIDHPTQRPIWLWEYFKSDFVALSHLPNRPETYLDKLIDEDENVWLVLLDEKFWFYEGKIKTIQMMIDESWFDELYIVSKHYTWLVCINHSDCLIALNEPVRQRLLTLNEELKKAHF